MAERCLAFRREHHAMDPRRFRAAQEGADVLGVLERVEDDDERRLGALDGAGQEIVDRCEPARLDHDGDALVAVEAGERRQRATLDLHDRDSEGRRVEHDPFEGLAALRGHQQATSRALRCESLLHGPAPGDELFAFLERRSRRGRRGAVGHRTAIGSTPAAVRSRLSGTWRSRAAVQRPFLE